MTINFLSLYIPVADAISALLTPNGEVVIHEISTDKVYYVANPCSGRKAGDVSLLQLRADDLENETRIIGPYEKAGERGQTIISVTAVLRDRQNRVQGLMCINMDYSKYDQALSLIESLVRPGQNQSHPEILFKNDWRDQIKLEVRNFLKENQLDLTKLDPAARRRLMSRLDDRGLFYAKKSIEQVAAMLDVSRATSYNDLQAVRKSTNSLEKKIRT